MSFGFDSIINEIDRELDKYNFAPTMHISNYRDSPFVNLKRSLVQSPPLQFYDVNKQLQKIKQLESSHNHTSTDEAIIPDYYYQQFNQPQIIINEPEQFSDELDISMLTSAQSIFEKSQKSKSIARYLANKQIQNHQKPTIRSTGANETLGYQEYTGNFAPDPLLKNVFVLWRNFTNSTRHRLKHLQQLKSFAFYTMYSTAQLRQSYKIVCSQTIERFDKILLQKSFNVLRLQNNKYTLFRDTIQLRILKTTFLEMRIKCNDNRTLYKLGEMFHILLLNRETIVNLLQLHRILFKNRQMLVKSLSAIRNKLIQLKLVENHINQNKRLLICKQIIQFLRDKCLEHQENIQIASSYSNRKLSKLCLNLLIRQYKMRFNVKLFRTMKQFQLLQRFWTIIQQSYMKRLKNYEFEQQIILKRNNKVTSISFYQLQIAQKYKFYDRVVQQISGEVNRFLKLKTFRELTKQIRNISKLDFQITFKNLKLQQKAFQNIFARFRKLFLTEICITASRKRTHLKLLLQIFTQRQQVKQFVLINQQQLKCKCFQLMVRKFKAYISDPVLVSKQFLQRKTYQALLEYKSVEDKGIMLLVAIQLKKKSLLLNTIALICRQIIVNMTKVQEFYQSKLLANVFRYIRNRFRYLFQMNYFFTHGKGNHIIEKNVAVQTFYQRQQSRLINQTISSFRMFTMHRSQQQVNITKLVKRVTFSYILKAHYQKLYDNQRSKNHYRFGLLFKTLRSLLKSYKKFKILNQLLMFSTFHVLKNKYKEQSEKHIQHEELLRSFERSKIQRIFVFVRNKAKQSQANRNKLRKIFKGWNKITEVKKQVGRLEFYNLVVVCASKQRFQ